jgi:PEGA domain
MTIARLLLASLLVIQFGRAEKANDTVAITSTPPGATVSWNRQVIGVTPMTYKVGEYAFNVKKSSAFSKHLAAPVALHIALEGFQPKDVIITKEYTWNSFNGKNHYNYFIIEVQEFDLKLDKISVAPKALTNADIIDLTAAGIGEQIIIDKINGAASAFSLETKDLIELKKAGVADAVVQAMMHKNAPAQ